MQWDANRNAGFSGAPPWLPIKADYKRYNVESEKRQSDSILDWYSALIRLRHQSLVFQKGDYVPIEAGNPEVFAFGRRISSNQLAIVFQLQSKAAESLHYWIERFVAPLSRSAGQPGFQCPHVPELHRARIRDFDHLDRKVASR